MTRALPVALARVVFAAPVDAARAAPACMPAAMVRDLLAKEYDERPADLGVKFAGRVIILYENRQSGPGASSSTHRAGSAA